MAESTSKRLQLLGAFPAPTDEQVKAAVDENMAANPEKYVGPAGANGEDGKDGADGQDGYTPVRGTDYWTDADKAEIKAYVDDALLGGAWY